MCERTQLDGWHLSKLVCGAAAARSPSPARASQLPVSFFNRTYAFSTPSLPPSLFLSQLCSVRPSPHTDVASTARCSAALPSILLLLLLLLTPSFSLPPSHSLIHPLDCARAQMPESPPRRRRWCGVGGASLSPSPSIPSSCGRSMTAAATATATAAPYRRRRSAFWRAAAEIS